MHTPHRKFQDPERTTPTGMLRYAFEFYAAGMAADDVLIEDREYEQMPAIPVFYLVGHAIELGLKAFLLQQGVTLNEIRDPKKYGHNLQPAYEEALQRGLDKHFIAPGESEAAFKILDVLYSSKEFEYVETGSKVFPVFGQLQAFASPLLVAIAQNIEHGPRLLQTRAGRFVTR